jgi:outer membrane protein assembly factor BamB
MTLLLIAALISAAPDGDTWPAFRGRGDSVSYAESLPLRWGEQTGVAWTSDIAGYGQSSPVVWRDRIFVTSVEGKNKEKSLVTCFDLKSGRMIWSKDFSSSQPAEVNDYMSRGAPTPAVDDRRVYAFFETGDLVVLDHDGHVLWQRSITTDYGKFLGNHGLGSSLALTGDAVIVLVCHDGSSYLLAIDKATGTTRWKIDRPQQVSWSSPIYDAGRGQIVISSSGTCEAIDAQSGRQLWVAGGMEGNTVPSATITDELVVVGSSEIGSNVAIRRGGQADVSGTHISWRSASATASFNSPLVYRDHVYMVNRAGVAYCLDLRSGKTVWNYRLGDSCWASPLGAADRVYFFGKSGKTTVVAAGPALEVLAENILPTDDRVYGVAAVNGVLIVRTGSELMCIHKAEAESKPTMEPKSQEPPTTEQANHEQPNANRNYPALPQAITSFGAAILDGSLYVYGGHFGTAHHYSEAGQSNRLMRLKLDGPRAWEEVSKGPKLQGLALVAYGGMLYRVGGFTARNQEGDDQDLWSQADFDRFDPGTGKWQALPPLPSPRSSFDAVVSGDKLFVVGGWTLQGEKETTWPASAYSVELSERSLDWQAIPQPPFQRRAISVGALDGKLYVIGGMQPDGSITTETAILNPEMGNWSQGPMLPGDKMEGFGTACCTLAGRLYVSTISGKLLRLSDDGKSWQLVRQLSEARFFHRMMPIGDNRLLLLGGANMEKGKFSSLEMVEVTP